jgi:hypothetical protein
MSKKLNKMRICSWSHSHKISAAMSQSWDKIASAQSCLWFRQLLPKFGQTFQAGSWALPALAVRMNLRLHCLICSCLVCFILAQNFEPILAGIERARCNEFITKSSAAFLSSSIHSRSDGASCAGNAQLFHCIFHRTVLSEIRHTGCDDFITIRHFSFRPFMADAMANLVQLMNNFLSCIFIRPNLTKIGHTDCGAFATTFHSRALIEAKPNHDGQFSRDFSLLCAMIAQNAYANGGATNQREREETKERGRLLGQGN